jgi:hypothetical protein
MVLIDSEFKWHGMGINKSNLNVKKQHHLQLVQRPSLPSVQTIYQQNQPLDTSTSRFEHKEHPRLVMRPQ